MLIIRVLNYSKWAVETADKKHVLPDLNSAG